MLLFAVLAGLPLEYEVIVGSLYLDLSAGDLFFAGDILLGNGYLCLLLLGDDLCVANGELGVVLICKEVTCLGGLVSLSCCTLDLGHAAVFNCELEDGSYDLVFLVGFRINKCCVRACCGLL